MQIHQIKRRVPNKKSVKVGRGGKRGKTSGRGTKGQKARAGRKLRPEIRDTIKKIPKLRGYRFKSIETKPFVLNLDVLSKNFKEGEVVNLVSLKEKGLVKKKSSKGLSVKILGNGKIDKKLSFEGLKVSKSAQSGIEKAGGSVK